MSLLGSIFGSGGILSSVLNLASMVFPALQLAASLFNMISKAVEGAIKGVMDQLMQDGLPKFIGNAVKDLATKDIGGSQQPSEAGPDQAMQEQNGADMQALQDNLTKAAVQDVNDSKDDSGGGWLVALAKAFGKMADKAAAKLEKMGKELSDKKPSDQLAYQAKTQEFSQMMNSFVNAIKTIGEANVATVRKG